MVDKADGHQPDEPRTFAKSKPPKFCERCGAELITGSYDVEYDAHTGKATGSGVEERRCVLGHQVWRLDPDTDRWAS